MPEDGPYDQEAIPSSDDFETDPDVWDIIVVGAGVAGSTLAAVQGKVSQGLRL